MLLGPEPIYRVYPSAILHTLFVISLVFVLLWFLLVIKRLIPNNLLLVVAVVLGLLVSVSSIEKISYSMSDSMMTGIKLDLTPSGIVLGWPMPFIEYEVSGLVQKQIDVQSQSDQINAILHKYFSYPKSRYLFNTDLPISFTTFYTIIFTLNTLFWIGVFYTLSCFVYKRNKVR